MYEKIADTNWWLRRGVNLPYIHEFGLVECIETMEEYIGYEPEKYNCIRVDGDLFDELLSKDFGEKCIS